MTGLGALGTVGQPKRATQHRVIALFRDELRYRYLDFSVKPRLSSERGNAILVASSIYEACKYFALFQKTPFKGKCAVVTSYNPLAKDVTMEETAPTPRPTSSSSTTRIASC